VKLVVATVGKVRDRSLAEAIVDYEQRATHYWPIETRVAKEEPARSLAVEQVKDREGERLLALVPDGAVLVACDVGGRSLTSEQFAAWLGKQRDEARDVVFAIGGAHGLSAEIRRVARWSLSLAPWTLPHELAKLVLVEQIYRAGTILRGEPYHKA
jgi:23S rRNA (pseudouridine1915-N3)-methyltransferase